MPYLIIRCGVMLVFALMVWDIDNNKSKVRVIVADESNSYTCERMLFGASNWCLLFAIVVVFVSMLYGCFGSQKRAFRR